MPTLTPQITIAGNTADLFGAEQSGTLVVQLCNFGSQIPRVSGTALIAQTSPLPIQITAGAYNFKLWGNDVITPSDTFYTIRAVDANGNTVQINAYQFTGTETIDLSSANPYNPPPYPTYLPPMQYVPATPQPAQAANTTYTAPAPFIMVFYGGVAQRPTLDFVKLNPTQFTLNFETYDGENVYVLCL